ncbi:uncharacterized protein UV8b_04961 [Ustilaginoidea virens]|uniref:Uncharacterized protein n=1 Tax=Ustilaginoidea virens TaxID=1159556 RepID=A0A8E5HSA7_USTVR|nr:uncharacterized protein UV8b_04961 [Ustilaginoidea virens]QUC20720.1 hypothetical protein UV8b_04961 [Ustilaginoidea virens]
MPGPCVTMYGNTCRRHVIPNFWTVNERINLSSKWFHSADPRPLRSRPHLLLVFAPQVQLSPQSQGRGPLQLQPDPQSQAIRDISKFAWCCFAGSRSGSYIPVVNVVAAITVYCGQRLSALSSP